MKNFDLEKALAGYPVCTRDGHKARIICFDARGAYPVVALVDCGDDGEGPVSYMTNGQVRSGLETEFDLFMAHVKHDGLVNIYKTEDRVITSGRTFDNEEKARAYDMALEAMSDIIPDENGLVHIRPSDIFSELKESEDERIRKELIVEVKHHIEYIPAPDCRDKEDEKTLKQLNSWLAWLEKQGQVKESDIPQHENQTCKENSNSLTGCKLPIKWTQDNIDDLTEFEAEMMHVGESFFGEYAGLNPNDTMSVRIQAKMLLELAPKPKWGDDDKQYLLVCKNALRKYQVSDKWDADIISKWLEDKLKQAEQKTKWTEEDEKVFNNLIGGLIRISHRTFTDCTSPNYTFFTEIEWLKELKQRMEE